MNKRFNSPKQNKARHFNAIMPAVNHEWASKVLNLSVNPTKGPDLINQNKFVEIKFAVSPNSKNYVKWTVLEYQMKYQEQNPDKKAFWGLGTYNLKQPASTILTKEPDELESLVISRELFIVNWDWMNQFPTYHNSGQTEKSKWDHSLRHPKKNKLPQITNTIKVHKGLVHLTEESQQQYFPHLK